MQLGFQESTVATVFPQSHVVPLTFLYHLRSIFYQEPQVISKTKHIVIEVTYKITSREKKIHLSQ